MIENPRRSVLQDWVMQLPLREQGVLLTSVRGCDLTPKHPLDSPERELVGIVRHAFMVPADPREVDHSSGSFFRSHLSRSFKPSAFGHYPQHWVSHIMHAIEVIGYRHPNMQRRAMFHSLYLAFCKSFHVNPETFEQYESRLSEDRIATGEVVS